MNNETIFGVVKDKEYMEQAIVHAQAAYAAEEVPVGAVVVDENGEIIGWGSNTVEQEQSQYAHAEVHALAMAGKKKRDWRLQDCWLYVTLEPCIMCMGLLYLSRVQGVVFGASSPMFGAHSHKDIFPQMYKNNMLIVIGGVCKLQTRELLRQFFQQQRKKGEQKKS
ncbi:MAG TPA: nucleoside deaminase [Candidatus Bathyarchaeia archaeon]|nr:nucleoside deaminase [Candidatus Bathyarchaeia archaeon]